MASSIEAICNQALDVIGYKRHIGNLFDGKRESRIALNLYGQTRDEVLASQPWEFARAQASLVSSGVSALPPWSFSYLYPATSVRLLNVFQIPASDIVPARWQEANDSRVASPSRIILCNISAPTATFTLRQMDYTAFPSYFTWELVMALAEKFRIELEKDMQGASRGSGQQQPRTDRAPQ